MVFFEQYILSTLLWLIFVVITSVMEAAIFSQVLGERPSKIDKHAALMVLRVYVFLLCTREPSLFLYLLLPMAFTFPYLHDGVYYVARNEMDNSVYTDRWRSESKTTDAKFSFSWNNRKVFFTIGVILWLSTFLLFVK